MPAGDSLQSLHAKCFLLTNSLPAVTTSAEDIMTVQTGMIIGAKLGGSTKLDTWPSGGVAAGRAQRSTPEVSCIVSYRVLGLYMRQGEDRDGPSRGAT